MKDVRTGHTLSEKGDVTLESMEFPEPVVAVSIEPVSKSDQDQLAKGMNKLSEEDPTFQVKVDSETGQTVISGMGEVHLEIIIDRLKREFNVNANVGKPQVSFREAIQKSVEKIDEKFVRQSGGRGQYGHVVINVKPTEQGTGYKFINKIVGGVIPREYIPAVDAGIKEQLQNGVLHGYPIPDVEVELVYGSYHDVDSSEIAFKVAGSRDGITAIQMDLKIDGLPIDLMKEALQQAKEGRIHILGEMNKALSESRADVGRHTPKMEQITVDKKDIAAVIGKGGATIREIVEKSGAKVDVNDKRESNQRYLHRQ